MNKYLDSNGLLYLWTKIKTFVTSSVSDKVDKVEGKTLTSNDFTDTLKDKLDGLENYELPKATASTLGGIKVGAGFEIGSDGTLNATGGGTADAVDWSNIQNKPDVALKSDITSVYHYKGSVENYAYLPTTGNEIGDVWDVKSSGMNYGWTGTEWDALGQLVEIDAITNAEIDTIVSGE